MKPLITVIVPIYKTEQYLEKCVQSIVNQTYQNLEIILVDDGSPDCAGEICDCWQHKDDRIIVIHQENAGTSSAKNRALDIAKGEYICFIDSDDFPEADMIEQLYNDIKQFKTDMAICEFTNFYREEDIVVKKKEAHTEVITPKQALNRIYEPYSDRIIIPANKLYHKNIWESIRYPIGRIYEDNAVIHKILAECDTISFNHNSFYFRRLRPDSIMGKSKAEFSEKNLQVLDYMKERCVIYGRDSDKVFAAKVYAQYLQNLLLSFYRVDAYLNESNLCNQLFREFCATYQEAIEQVNFDWVKRIKYWMFIHCTGCLKVLLKKQI